MRAVVVLAVVCLAAPAAAQPIDLEGVDPCARARSGKDAEPGTVLIYLGLCRAGGTDVGGDIAGLEAKLRARGYVDVTVEVTPAVDGAVGFVDGLGNVPFAVPGTVLVPPGTHQVGAVAPGHHGAAQQVTFTARAKPTTISLRLDPIGDRPGNTTDVDFSDDHEAAAPTTAEDLPDAEHDELLKDKFRRGLEADGEAVATGRKRHALGAAAGLSVGNLSGTDADARVGLSAALLVSYRVRGAIAFMPELGFAQRGADGASVDYLTVPVRLGYVSGASPIAVFGAAGPELAIAVSSDAGMADAATMDLGFSAGGGARIPLGAGALSIDFYLRLGFTEVIDGTDARDRSASLRAGYLF